MYGNTLQPIIEKVSLNTSESHICLIRDVQKALALKTDDAVTKVRTPVVNSDTKVLVPGIPGHSAAVKTPSSGKEKKKSKRKPGETEDSIEERLGALDIDVSKVKTPGGLPQTDSFAVLLVQGLESNDEDILNKVLSTRKETLIKNTVARMPIHAVIPLLHECLTNGSMAEVCFYSTCVLPFHIARPYSSAGNAIPVNGEQSKNSAEAFPSTWKTLPSRHPGCSIGNSSGCDGG